MTWLPHIRHVAANVCHVANKIIFLKKPEFSIKKMKPAFWRKKKKREKKKTEPFPPARPTSFRPPRPRNPPPPPARPATHLTSPRPSFTLLILSLEPKPPKIPRSKIVNESESSPRQVSLFALLFVYAEILCSWSCLFVKVGNFACWNW